MGFLDGRQPHAALRIASATLGALPDGLGQFRVAYAYAERSRASGRAIQRMHSGITVELDLADRTQLVAYLIRRHDQELTQCIVSRLPPDGVMFDVGAHVGLVSFAVAARRPEATVKAFEPNPVNIAAWKINRRLNLAANTALHEVAVTDRDDAVRLFMGIDSGSSRVLDHGETLPEGWVVADEAVVPAVTLDRFCEQQGVERIDVLKIDIEGHEAAALRGAERLLLRGGIRAIVMEKQRNEAHMDRCLGRFGFRREPIPRVGLRRLRRRPPIGDVAYVL